MQKRTCTHCHTIKSLSEFYIQKGRPAGYKSWGKLSANASVATYRQTAQGKKIVYENVRRYSHSKKGLEAAHRYRHSQKGLETARHYWHKNYTPPIGRARNAVMRAIATHKKPPAKTLRCFDCHAQAMDYHHWRGYDKINLLNVIPLCRKCHRNAV